MAMLPEVQQYRYQIVLPRTALARTYEWQVHN